MDEILNFQISKIASPKSLGDTPSPLHAIQTTIGHLFSETPGRYTGKFGDCDISLQFVTEQVQTRKVCVPNYSAEMKKLMCDKMNELYDAGILAFPEELQR